MRSREVNVDSALFGNMDLEAIAATMGFGAVQTLEPPTEFDPIILPSTSHTAKGKKEIRSTAGDVVTCYVKRFEGPSSTDKHSAKTILHGGNHLKEAVYEARQLKLWNELFIPSPAFFAVYELAGVDSAVNVIDIMMKYLPGPTCQDDLLAIRQEAKALNPKDSESGKMRHILTNLANSVVVHMLRTNAELQVKGTYTLRTGKGPNPKIDLTQLLAVYDPSSDDDFDPVVSRCGPANDSGINFYIQRRFADVARHLLRFKHPTILGDNLETKVSDLCTAFTPVFKILLDECFRTYSHGDENGMNCKILRHSKPHDAPNVRALIFDSSNVLVAPAYLGAASFIVDSILNCSYKGSMHLARQYIQIGQRIESYFRYIKKQWGQQKFNVFPNPAAGELNRDLFLMDIAMLYMGFRFAGVGVRHEVNGNGGYKSFVEDETDYCNPLLDIPGKNHTRVSYKPFENRGEHGEDGKVARLMYRVSERLERITSGKTPYKIRDEERKLVNEFYHVLKETFGEEFFMYKGRSVSEKV